MKPGLGVTRGVALYVGALLGPGLLLVPALAVQTAGPASVLAWAALLVLSAPLAITFAILGVRHPVPGGVSAYVREGFGERAAAVTGACFLTAVVVGGPAVALIGGVYVADLMGAGTGVALVAAAAMFACVLAGNALGLRVSSGAQLAMAAVLVTLIVVAIAVALPGRAGDNWTPFAPHGWWAVGTAANLLVWHFIGWEAMAQLAGDFRDPRRDVPRAIAIAFGIIAVLYVALAVATVAVTGGIVSNVPLADLLGAGLGETGRQLTAVAAVALTMGTMNVYTGGSAKLAADLAPVTLGGGGGDVPRRPLIVLALTGSLLLALLAAGWAGPAELVRATSACFISVYLLALASAARILRGAGRLAAVASLILVAVVAAFSGAYLLLPAAVAAITLLATGAAGATAARGRPPRWRPGSARRRAG